MLKLDGQTAVQRTFGRSFWTISLFFAVFIGLADVLHAQITAENPLKFKVAPEPANSSKIDIPNPIKTEWKYNPKENRYEGYRQIGSLSYPTGEILSVNEYFKKIAQTADQQYFREKSKSNTTVSSTGGITDLIKGELNNPAISKIFGEGGVDFQLSG
ncbi:MAG: hypothetical protein ACK448_03715, partial [Bacteroidota bacterium]